MREEKSIIPAFVTLTHVSGPKVSVREDHILAVRGGGNKATTQLFIARDQNHEMINIREDARAIPGPFADFNVSEGRVLRINIHFIAAVGHDDKHDSVTILDTNGKDGSWHISDSHDRALRAIQTAWEKLSP